jgi:hypothetical protein
MAGLKTRSPRAARTKQLVQVDDLTGGVDLRRSPTLLRPERARTLKNISLEEPGALMMRPGYVRASSASLGSGRAQGGQRVYLASTVFSLVAWSGAVYRPTDAWAFGASVHSTISTGNQVFFPYDRDIVAVMDGANRPRFSTAGTTWHLMGTDAPSSAAALSSVNSGSGALSTGEFAVAYAYKHRGTAFESNIGAESTITLTASSANSIHVAASPSTDTKNDAYVFYARHKLPDQESVLRRVSSGAASTYTILSSQWTSADEPNTNYDVPPTGLRFAMVWKNRWWAPSGTVGTRLHFTELFLSQAWPSDYYIDLPFEKGDEITAVQPLGDTLLVHGQSGIFLIIGQTSLDFEVRPSQGSESGALGPRAVDRLEQAVVHVAASGIDSFDGATDRSLEYEIQPAWQDMVSNSGSTSLDLVACVHDQLRQEFRVTVPRVYPTGARGEWILNLDRTRENQGAPAWTSTDRDIAFYMYWNGNEPTAGNRGRLFSMPAGQSASTLGGIVFEENIGASANSSNMTCEYEGSALSLGLHRARVTDLHLEYEPHAGAFSVEVVVDGVSQGQIGMSLGSGLYFYGAAESIYGTATYGGAGRKKAYTPLPLRSDGRTATVKYSYTGTERTKVFSYALGIVPEVVPRQFNE